MIEIKSGKSENLIVAVAYDKVTEEDYEKVLLPAIEAKLNIHKKIRLLYQLGDEFSGYTTEEIWDDAKLGLGHWAAFEKIALVTEVTWIANSVKFFRFLMPCPVKVFTNVQLVKAESWVTGC